MLCLKVFKLKTKTKSTLQSQNKVCRPQPSAKATEKFLSKKEAGSERYIKKKNQVVVQMERKPKSSGQARRNKALN